MSNRNSVTRPLMAKKREDDNIDNDSDSIYVKHRLGVIFRETKYLTVIQIQFVVILLRLFVFLMFPLMALLNEPLYNIEISFIITWSMAGLAFIIGILCIISVSCIKGDYRVSTRILGWIVYEFVYSTIIAGIFSHLLKEGATTIGAITQMDLQIKYFLNQYMCIVFYLIDFYSFCVLLAYRIEMQE
jgi:hypothetical protein